MKGIQVRVNAHFSKILFFFKKNIQQIFTPFSLETWWHKWPKDAFKKNKNVFRTHYLYLCAYMLSRFSCVQLFQTLGTVAHLQPVPLFWDSSGKNTGGLPCPLPGDCPNPGMEPCLSYLFTTRQALHH